jgi:adenylate cyclase
MIELEKTYLVKLLPEGIKNCDSKEIIDVYIPASSEHPTLRIRKNGDKYEMTKKEPILGNDASEQEEQTIILTENEFNGLKDINGKIVRKIRYFYKHNNKIAEIDVFQDRLKGLVLVDFEFNTKEEKDSFEIPDFCLTDVTQEKFIAGGMLCGKSFEDIKEDLTKLNYNSITLD